MIETNGNLFMCVLSVLVNKINAICLNLPPRSKVINYYYTKANKIQLGLIHDKALVH